MERGKQVKDGTNKGGRGRGSTGKNACEAEGLSTNSSGSSPSSEPNQHSNYRIAATFPRQSQSHEDGNATGLAAPPASGDARHLCRECHCPTSRVPRQGPIIGQPLQQDKGTSTSLTPPGNSQSPRTASSVDIAVGTRPSPLPRGLARNEKEN